MEFDEFGSMPRPAITVHSLDHARVALSVARELGVEVTLVSAPGAAAYVGAAVFREMIEAAAGSVPDARFTAVLDCGDDPGLALAALRAGLPAIRLDAGADVRARVTDIAARTGAVLVDSDAAALDLIDVADPARACREWLAPGDEGTPT